MQRILSYPRLWLVFAIVVVLFAVTGPFGTFDRLAFHSRLGYWLSVHAVAWLSAIASTVFFNLALAGTVASVLVRMVVGAVVAALPIAAAVTAHNAIFLGVSVSAAALAGNLAHALPVSVAVSLIVFFALEGTDPDDPEGTAAAPDAAGAADPAPPAAPVPAAFVRPRILDRLPVDKRGVLIRLEVEDHYVRAITDRGSEMLLMRLADAIAEAGDGIRLHRSHWVSRAGAGTLAREPGRNGRLVLVAADGARLPVSRSHAHAVQDWLKPPATRAPLRGQRSGNGP